MTTFQNSARKGLTREPCALCARSARARKSSLQCLAATCVSGGYLRITALWWTVILDRARHPWSLVTARGYDELTRKHFLRHCFQDRRVFEDGRSQVSAGAASAETGRRQVPRLVGGSIADEAWEDYLGDRPPNPPWTTRWCVRFLPKEGSLTSTTRTCATGGDWTSTAGHSLGFWSFWEPLRSSWATVRERSSSFES